MSTRPFARRTPHLALSLLLAAPLLAHGGQYRGPSDVKPSTGSTTPSGGGTSGLGSTSPGASSVPVPSGGAAGPGSAGGRGSAGSAARGYVVGDDLGRWEYWWEFGKDPFLQLRDLLYAAEKDPGQALWNPRLRAGRRDIQPPNEADVRQVARQLADVLERSDDRDTISACMVALAKIGSTRAGFDVPALLRGQLDDGDQELRETAAVALGIDGAAADETVELLADLIGDTSAARAVSGDRPVNERTRAFAAFGSGLLLGRTRSAATALRLSRPLEAVVAAPGTHGRNLVVASIEALAQFPREWDRAGAQVLRERIVAVLTTYYERDLGAGDQLVQAHVPTAIARLVQRDSREAAAWRARCAADLRAGLRRSGARAGAKVNHHVAQSCALALGTLCEPWVDENSPSRAFGELLIEVNREHRDQQTRSFAALALAYMGGKAAADYLLGELADANKAIEQPWLAVSLGVLAARAGDGPKPGFDRDAVHAALIEAFGEARNPSTVGALAIALGLCHADSAREVVRRRLVEGRKRDDLAGYCALALGLLEDRAAIPDLRFLRRDAARRPFVLTQTARALGMLGDHTLTAELSTELAEPSQPLIRLAATAAALGQIGDRRCLPALQALVVDDDATPLTRAFAAVALGSVCDKDPLPWNAVYATNVNYRAATETLTDGGTGILDLL